MDELTIKCKNIISTSMRIPLEYSNESFSFVGGVDIKTGVVSDYRHPSYQKSIKDKAFAFPFGKGSSGAGLVIMEMQRVGTAPAAIVNIHTDPVILTGPLVLKNFYDQTIPVINLSIEDYEKLSGAKEIELFSDRDEIIAYY